ncbi:methionine synthase [Methanosphaera cuniculi]|uniref:methionine synthase n=1 Tax=Methanosphaera cuniculi TaxID=1077256 RepID=UPI0026F0CBC2|nr:methionine synthase [Methanosphaera cuniculi]
MNIITTVVGSYPIDDEYKPDTFNEKILDKLDMYDEFKKPIYQTVDDYVKYNIDIICDGQPRNDMVKIFTSKINGFETIDNTVHIIGKITPSASPIGVSDLKYAAKIAHQKNPKYQLYATIDEIFKHEKCGIKGMITGPTSIIHSCNITNFYEDRKSAIYDLAYALQDEAKALEKAGACAIQIDEPFISTGVEDIEVSRRGVEIISKAVNIPVILHVCGDLEDVLEDLLEFNVEILDFEFRGMPENIKTLKKVWNKNTDKIISIGCIDTKLHEVDNIKDVVNTIKQVVDITDEKNVIIDPDCGMRMLDKNIAQEKLNLLDEIKKEGV